MGIVLCLLFKLFESFKANRVHVYRVAMTFSRKPEKSSRIADCLRFVGTNFREFGFQTLPLGTNFRGSQFFTYGSLVYFTLNFLYSCHESSITSQRLRLGVFRMPSGHTKKNLIDSAKIHPTRYSPTIRLFRVTTGSPSDPKRSKSVFFSGRIRSRELDNQ